MTTKRRGLTDTEAIMAWRFWRKWYQSLSADERKAFNALSHKQQTAALLRIERKLKKQQTA